jgi:hypothetical protein
VSEAEGGGESLPKLSIVFAYYENPQMLDFQWREIAAYPSSIQSELEVIVVDDGSPLFPAVEVPRPKGLPAVSIFRIDQDTPWNQDAARNIGAHEARSPWLLLTDIDHVIPASSLCRIFEGNQVTDAFYTLGRVKIHGQGPTHPHSNSYLMTKELYWRIGGHDEDFAGVYGKDILFRKRARSRFQEVHLPEVLLARVGSSVIKHAGTTSITRKNTFARRSWGYALEWLKIARLWRGVQTLSHPYTKVF